MDSDQPATPIALPAGARFGAYEVVRVLGTGAFGTVYEALRHPLRKRVALKVLHADMARSPEAVARFLREAEAAAQLDHPHIVDVQDLGAINGSSFIAMEFLEGETLDARIDRVTRLSVADTLDVMLPVLSAVAAVHQRGLIHRDLKPANVFLTPGPQGDFPRLLDFGIAKDTTSSNSLTRTASVLGTPSYMSPEQVRESRLIDVRTDVWALGVVLHECVTGRRPFDGSSLFETFEQIMRGPILPPGATVPDVDPGFDVVVLHALQRDPDQRVATVRELGAALLPFASPAARAAWSRDFARPETPTLATTATPSGESPAAPRVPPITLAAQSLPIVPTVPMRPMRPVILIAGALTTLLIVVAALVSFRGRASAPASRPLVVHSNPAPPPPPAVVDPPPAAVAPPPVAAPPVEPAAPPVAAPDTAPTPAITPARTPPVRRPANPVRPVRPVRPNPVPTPPAGIGNY